MITLTIILPPELREELMYDEDLSVAEINVEEKYVIIYDARNRRYDRWKISDGEQFQIRLIDGI